MLVDSRPDRWAEVFAGLDQSVRAVVCGHTHMPFSRLADRRLVVNPGSVGMPYGGAGAHWALLGPGVQLRVTEFDLDKACDRIAAESATRMRESGPSTTSGQRPATSKRSPSSAPATAAEHQPVKSGRSCLRHSPGRVTYSA